MSNMLNKQTTGCIRGGFMEEVTFPLDFWVGVRVEVKDVKGSFRLKTDGREAIQRTVVRLSCWACDSPGKTRMFRCIRKVSGDKWATLSRSSVPTHSQHGKPQFDPRLKMNQKTSVPGLCLLVPVPYIPHGCVALFSSLHPFSNKSSLCVCLLRCSSW